jgi:hypothetical protein
LTTVMITAAIRATMMPYSTAVAPLSLSFISWIRVIEEHQIFSNRSCTLFPPGSAMACVVLNHL